MMVFNGWYYSWAPLLAHIAETNSAVAASLRVILIPLFGVLIVSSFAYFVGAWFSPEVGVILAGVVAASLIGAVYLAPVAYVVSRALRLRTRTGGVLAKVLTPCVVVSGILVGASTITKSFPIVAVTTLGLTLSSLTLGAILGVRALNSPLALMATRGHKLVTFSWTHHPEIQLRLFGPFCHLPKNGNTRH
jgi:hypothetical protein